MQPSFCDRRRLALRLGLGALAIAGALAELGCGGTCDTSDEENAPQRYTAGVASGGVYESSPWKSGFLPFPGGKQYQLEHHLGFTPAVVDIFIAFSADGERVAPCAGNSCLVRCVDDQLVWIKNDTCSEFWVRVATSGKSATSEGMLCQGGGVDAATTTPDGPSGGDADVGTTDAAADTGDANTTDSATPAE
jgi:hypothetical protein